MSRPRAWRERRERKAAPEVVEATPWTPSASTWICPKRDRPCYRLACYEFDRCTEERDAR